MNIRTASREQANSNNGSKGIVCVVVLLGLFGSVMADPLPTKGGSNRSVSTVEEKLLQRLEQRDAIIVDLQQRVAVLEQQLSGKGAKTQPEPKTYKTNAQPQAATKPNQQTASNEAAQTTSAPGEFEVDEDAAERALERTLIQAGVLLLPFGQAEIEPSFSYTRTELDAPTFFAQDGTAFIGTNNVRRNVLDTALQLRFGLPYDSQFEFRVPYRYVDRSEITTVGSGQPNTETDGSGSGWGDISVGLAKTFLREGRWSPDIVGRFTWDADNGETRSNDVFLGGGFHEFTGSLSMVKRQDPLAFVGGATYTTALKSGGVEPGDQFSFSMGAALAASPDTSLRFSLSQTFTNDLEVDNTVINGSDRVDGRLTLGASSIIGRGKLLDVSTSIGLTDEAPDYSVRVSLGTRFNFLNAF